MDLGLADSVFIVTGGSRGLGRATAEVLVAEGARVVLSGRTEEYVEKAVHELGEQCVGVVADNADPKSAEMLVGEAQRSFGRLDGALISVGGPMRGAVTEISDDQWREAFENVFVGGLRLARTVAAAVGAGGSIAFVLSTSVRAPLDGMAISNGLRPGLAMAAKSLADELGPQGIRVNSLLPARVETERVRWMDEQADDPQWSKDARVRRIPLRRYGVPEEFGRVAAFVLSPAASYVSGAAVPVDGGALRTL
ncbi:SDR family oxidoreductase [Solicola gregarius]|uniref:SDR family oxidoreductase n=1 Tax=Solicola gregarius TaxID=2908642 RepID=A0AA46TI60_9ACTN|nr:SDR family oxidoreductase [Solicola gregarius]UYM04958.1 SDR family oxidoreductase [Solicola gregarius]